MTDASLGERGQEVGEYLLSERLGAGTYGAVWKARHKLLRDQEIAVKLFPPETEGRRIVREAQALRSVQSPHVPRLLGGDAEADRPYIVMEFIPGESLRGVLQRSGKLREGEAVDLAKQVLQGLDAAHAKGMLHRDIKPENIIVQGSLGAKGCRVVLVDFGLARMGEGGGDGTLQLSGGLRSAQEIAGTPVYMAPEVLSGKPATEQSDLFSTGLVLHECLTGRTPTAVRMFTFPMQGVSAGLSSWLQRSLSEDASSRWNDAATALTPLCVTPIGDSPPMLSPAKQATRNGPVTISMLPFAWFGLIAMVVGIVYSAWHDSESHAQQKWMHDRSQELAKSPEPGPARPALLAGGQPKNCVDVNGTAEFDYIPGRSGGDARIASLPSEDEGHSLCLFISPGTGSGDSTWWVRISPVDAGESDIIAEFKLPADKVGSVRLHVRDAVYDRSNPSQPLSLRQAFKTELTALHLGMDNTVRRLAVRVQVQTER